MNSLETKVLELIGEDVDSPDVFVDTDAGMAPIRDSLNDAIQEIVMLTGSKTSKYFLPLRQEQMFYRFSLANGYLGWVTDAWSVNQKYRLEQTDLVRLTAYDPRWMVTSAEPRAYCQIGQDVIGVWPKPGSHSNIIELTVVEIPAEYETSTDRINIRREYEYAAINFAVAEFWASRGDARQAETFFGYYLQALGLNDRLTDSRDRIAIAQTNKAPWPSETA